MFWKLVTLGSECEETQVEEITRDHFIDYFIVYLSGSRLGQIANEWVAYADRSINGAADKECMWLAEQHFVEVDYPKTGIHGKLPSNPPKEYPSYMAADNQPSYESVSVLGKLYERTKSIYTVVSYNESKSPSIVVEDSNKYLEEAKTIYKRYEYHVRALMRLYYLEHEAELITGCFTKLPGHLKKESHNISFEVKRKWKLIREEFRKEFFHEISPDEQIPKALSWMRALYEASEYQYPLMSFGWIVDDIIVQLLSQNLSQTITQNSLKENILTYFNNKKYELLSNYFTRLDILNEFKVKMELYIFLTLFRGIVIILKCLVPLLYFYLT